MGDKWVVSRDAKLKTKQKGSPKRHGLRIQGSGLSRGVKRSHSVSRHHKSRCQEGHAM